MRNIKIFILIQVAIIALLFSCGLKSNDRKTAALSDSLIKATEDIAIGEAKFGMSEKQFNELYPDSLIEIDGNKYVLDTYYNNSQELNMVYLLDYETIGNMKFDQTLLNRMDLLKKYFMKTYGTPILDKGYPKQEKMLNGKSFSTYTWEVGKKKIFVGLALEETDRGNVYYVLAHVDRKDL